MRGLDAGQNLVEVAPARDGAKFRGVERVQRDVDAAHAAVPQFAGKPCELRAVGGQRQFSQRAAVEMARQRAHQRHHVAADEGLAAGQTQLSHALGDEGRAQPVEFFEREQIGLGQERHVFRHAIEAAQVAAVGDRHPQIADRPAKRVGHRARQRGGRIRGRSRHFNRLPDAATLPRPGRHPPLSLNLSIRPWHIQSIVVSGRVGGGGVGGCGAAVAGGCCWSGNGEPEAGAGAALRRSSRLRRSLAGRLGRRSGWLQLGHHRIGIDRWPASSDRRCTSCTGRVTVWYSFMVKVTVNPPSGTATSTAHGVLQRTGRGTGVSSGGVAIPVGPARSAAPA